MQQTKREWAGHEVALTHTLATLVVMKRYEPPKPGVAFALAAAAMAVMTMIAFVVLPAELESFGHGGIAPFSDGDGGNVRQS
jgi:hypothetical protein